MISTKFALLWNLRWATGGLRLISNPGSSPMITCSPIQIREIPEIFAFKFRKGTPAFASAFAHFSDPLVSGNSVPMLSTPCESVQICTDPDRYSRIVRKLNSHKFSFRKRNWLLKKCSTKKTHLLFEVLKKFLCESVQICTDPCRYSRIC